MKRNFFCSKNILLVNLLALLISSPKAFSMDIDWNGFGSIYYGQALSRGLMPEGFHDTHVDFTNLSLMGLNLNASVTKEFTFAAQLVALGSPVGTTDSFGIMAQWAFLNYKPDPSYSLKLGRQLFPSMMASEYNRVGYLLPFHQVPFSVFGLTPFTRFDGISVSKEVSTDWGTLTFNAFGGSPVFDVNTTQVIGETFNFDDLVGAQLVLDGDGWRVRVMASQFNSEVIYSAPLPVGRVSGHTQTYSFGYRYDKNNLVSWSEYVLVQTPDGTPVGGGKYVGIGHGFYWLGGYRFGKWMPHYSFSQGSNNFYVVGASGYLNGKLTTHTIGVNYQIASQAVLKFEYEQMVLPSAQGGGYMVTQPAGSTISTAGAFYTGIDFIF